MFEGNTACFVLFFLFDRRIQPALHPGKRWSEEGLLHVFDWSTPWLFHTQTHTHTND